MDEASTEDIARIEERIENLRGQIARCRKLSLLAKVMIAAGGGWIALTLTQIVPYLPAPTFAALAAAIGGIVLLGSNATTWTQTEAALSASEALRNEWIENRTMRLVGEDRLLH
ncbi:MAG TPA: hypothetical protein VFA57_01765 [Pseudolabrys sp.]|jgi:hypothetical protein|nr:hypothetical protein [Pseudolabrys sp.]